MQRYLTALAAALLISGPALACEAPDIASIDIPSGAAATEAEMVQAQQAVADMVTAIEAYAVCVDGLSRIDQRDHIRDRDEAVDAAHRLATRMNREIRNFNRAVQLASR
ncbi:MAG: hypothetical protein JJU27_15415 [Gammaproteobacteria bacterium]|nr:hypothetical protein [Gammaproteobacteria bacterium]MCC5869891.1 hypothetical protein [Gammaproteobacteria bacterium]